MTYFTPFLTRKPNHFYKQINKSKRKVKKIDKKKTKATCLRCRIERMHIDVPKLEIKSVILQFSSRAFIRKFNVLLELSDKALKGW